MPRGIDALNNDSLGLLMTRPVHVNELTEEIDEGSVR